jgi:hypothetical protein
MTLQYLAPELLVHVFERLTSTTDIIHLSLTCRYFHTLLPKSQKLGLFFKAIDKELGPVDEILQLLTQNDNQPLHLRRAPPLSFALLAQASSVARTAQRYVSLYPVFKWTAEDSASRRSLDEDEARRLRRALYHFWSYTKAFHANIGSRSWRSDKAVSERLRMLRSWTSEELCELEDARSILEQLLASEICPTDGLVSSRHPEECKLSVRYPDFRPLRHPTTHTGFDDTFHSSREQRLSLVSSQLPAQELRYKYMEGWGSDLRNYYLVQSFLKLSPSQIFALYDGAITKSDVEAFIELHTGDSCFLESGSMLFHDLVTVLHARGGDVQQTREAIWDCRAGIVVNG